MKVILASTSPRRKDFMDMLEITYDTTSPDVDEMSIRDSNPEKLSILLAEAKADAVVSKYNEGIVIGSDTVVEFEDKIIEKAANEEEQRKLIHMQNGKFTVIISAVCFINIETGQKITKTKKTYFYMANLTDEQIEDYIKTGQGIGKGGGFGIQDENGLFIKKLDGCYPNSIGFPICLVADTLKEMGIDIKVNIREDVNRKLNKQC